MNTRIKLVLILTYFVLFGESLFSQTLPGVEEAYGIRTFNPGVYYESRSESHVSDLLNLPELAWEPLPDDLRIPSPEQTAWLKIVLPEGALGQDLYLTEHAGLHSWDIYFFSENLLLDQETISWDEYRRDYYNLQTQYRGFTSFQVFNSNHKDVVLLIRLNPTFVNEYNFYLRGRINFQKYYSSWLFVQGVGMGLILVILLLTLMITLRLMYRIDWLYLILVICSGLNLSFITGLGPQFTARYMPWVSQYFWLIMMGVFNIASITFIEEFSEIRKRFFYTRLYFRVLKLLSFLFAALILFIPRFQVFTFLKIGFAILTLMIFSGLIRLIVIRSFQASWFLAGWAGLFLFSIGKGLTADYFADAQSLLVIPDIFGTAIYLIFLGTALIKQIDQKRLNESIRRRSAEHVAESVLKRMSDHKRMADLGEMVSSVTHELGTPLGITVTLSSNITNIGRYIHQLFNDGDLSEEEFSHFMSDVLESSELIEKNMENARVLIDGFKQVASDQTAPDIREINLNQYVSQVVRILMTRIKKTPYNLNQHIPDDLILKTNPGILTQILTNLINNAVIHGFENRSEGTINVTAEQIEQENQELIRLTVEDDGNGIPPEIQEKIFNMYFTTRKGLGGTGVGLSIVKSLVEERLSGKVTLKSEPGRGSTFCILLPMNLEELV